MDGGLKYVQNETNSINTNTGNSPLEHRLYQRKPFNKLHVTVTESEQNAK